MIVLDFRKNSLHGPVCRAYATPFKPGEDGGLEQIKSIIGCNLIDVERLDHGIDMFVDDEGLLKSKPLLNHFATMMRYDFWRKHADHICFPACHPPVCGVVVLLGYDHETGDTVDLSDEQVEYVKSVIPMEG